MDICTNCGQPAEYTYENEGYSDCCNDRIERPAPAGNGSAIPCRWHYLPNCPAALCA